MRRLTLHTVRFIIIAATCISLSSGISHAGPDGRKRVAYPRPPKQPAHAAAPVPNMDATASNVRMTFTDPTTGKTLWTAKVKSVEATSKQNASAMFGTMHQVDGNLYQDATPVDRLRAPNVTVDNATQVVTATGGVLVNSLTQSSTQVTCDKMIYYAGKAKIVGFGHVVFKKGGFTQLGPSFAADVKLKAVVMPAPGSSSPNTGVHVVWKK